jgi:hypothetical protein
MPPIHPPANDRHFAGDSCRVPAQPFAGPTPIDTLVLASAARRGDVVYTSDADDLQKLAAYLCAVCVLGLVHVWNGLVRSRSFRQDSRVKVLRRGQLLQRRQAISLTIRRLGL